MAVSHTFLECSDCPGECFNAYIEISTLGVVGSRSVVVPVLVGYIFVNVSSFSLSPLSNTSLDFSSVQSSAGRTRPCLGTSPPGPFDQSRTETGTSSRLLRVNFKRSCALTHSNVNAVAFASCDHGSETAHHLQRCSDFRLCTSATNFCLSTLEKVAATLFKQRVSFFLLRKCRVYEALAFCLSSLYGLGYNNSLQAERRVEYSELGHAGYSVDGATW